MKKIIICILLISLTCPANPNEGKVYTIKKISTPIIIDGIIDPVWSEADSITDFVQYMPYHNAEPTRKTIAKLLTTDESLYCLIICYDDYENIQTTTGKLDDFAGDMLSLMIDTFNDKKTAYKFAVSASGVRADSRLLDDARNRDYSWDGIWFGDSKVYEWGFVVEMEIPYKSIQYNETLDYWGMDIDRWIPALNEDIYWCSYDQAEGQRVSKFGKFVFKDFRPSVKGLNLEIYPVAISKATYLRNNKYDIDPDIGLDIFYNPSPQLTLQLTANPDFAQIEADPFDFNISRYESYFNERRPFFTEGSEIFMPSGRQRSSGFYRPLELFYSRRIGKKLPDGSEVPLITGTKVFGRIDDWEYGGFAAVTGSKSYSIAGQEFEEPQSYFASGRIKKQFLGNSTIGLLYVGKYSPGNTYGVLNIDGAFRQSDWQLAYQAARSIKNSEGDFAASAGFVQFTNSWFNAVKAMHIGEKFDVNQVGFVPWRGTTDFTAITGPVWLFDQGYLRQLMFYGGASLDYNKEDLYTDHYGVLGFNMQFRDNWGYELNISGGRAKDLDKRYNSYQLIVSSWFNIHPKWSANLWGGRAKSYNFSRDYLAAYTWLGSSFSYKLLDILTAGTSYNMWIEGNPGGNVEDVTFNARPYFSLTPVNDLNLRVYVDNVFVRSTDRLERLIIGLLFSYNFSPKSWIYFAFNEVKDRRDRFDSDGIILPKILHTTNRAGVFKVKYLYYF